jgi:hypothetical protein
LNLPNVRQDVGRKLRRIAYPGVSRLDDLRKPNRLTDRCNRPARG